MRDAKRGALTRILRILDTIISGIACYSIILHIILHNSQSVCMIKTLSTFVLEVIE